MQTETQSRVAVISIIAESQESAATINEILHSGSEYIVGRMGIPYKEKNINIISVVIDAPVMIINSITGRLGRLAGVTAKATCSKK